MLQMRLFRFLSAGYVHFQEPDPLERIFEKGIERATLMFALTLWVFVLLNLAVRSLAQLTRMPVSRDPVDMARPKGFRTVMLGFAVLITPPIVLNFLPIEEMSARSLLVVTYVLEIFIGVSLWLILDVFYKTRGKR